MGSYCRNRLPCTVRSSLLGSTILIMLLHRRFSTTWNWMMSLEEKVGIFSRGVDADIFSPDKWDNSFLDEHRGILALYVGRISQEKNLDILVKIFREIDNVTLICVGDGTYKSEMQRQLQMHSSLAQSMIVQSWRGFMLRRISLFFPRLRRLSAK